MPQYVRLLADEKTSVDLRHAISGLFRNLSANEKDVHLMIRTPHLVITSLQLTKDANAVLREDAWALLANLFTCPKIVDELSDEVIAMLLDCISDTSPGALQVAQNICALRTADRKPIKVATSGRLPNILSGCLMMQDEVAIPSYRALANIATFPVAMATTQEISQTPILQMLELPNILQREKVIVPMFELIRLLCKGRRGYELVLGLEQPHTAAATIRNYANIIRSGKPS